MAVAEKLDRFDDKPGTDAPGVVGHLFAGNHDFHPEPGFDRLLYLERKRTERSRRPFLLLLLNVETLIPDSGKESFIRNLETVLSSSVRETDIKGWYEQGKVTGIILTELNSIDEVVQEKILLKIQDRLVQALGSEAVEKIRVSYHAFPESYKGNGGDREWLNTPLYPEVTKQPAVKKVPLFAKRVLDITGSLLGLVFLSPVFLAITLGIKLTSRGPVLFKQERLGQWGKAFTFLKFRSMYVNSDASPHKEYVTKLITGGNGTPPAGENGSSSAEGRKEGEVVYKMTSDPRITHLGRILRKTSLDELPQFINVLKGEMSLVGPRPPIPYEYEIYDLWHRNRVRTMKPGITGLWQVDGRSKTTFDNMVRLDLRYVQNWSLWLDIKILIKTVRAVLCTSGAV
jgi:exopolysaccharide biosynthesis polyprenyl glycosylphosphotransferase